MPARALAPLHLACESDTNRLGEALAGELRSGDTMLLDGSLGAGKTVLARSLLRRLAGDATLTVPSPTYTLAHTYDLPWGLVHHFDLYRLDNPEECVELGLEEVFGHDLALVEWPDRLGPLAPPEWICLRLVADGNPGARTAHVFTEGSDSLLRRAELAARRFLDETP